MKICIISSTVFPLPPSGYSGLEMIVWYLGRGLAAKGHGVSIVAPDGSTCPGCVIIPTGPPGGWGEAQAYGGFSYLPPEAAQVQDVAEREKLRKNVPPYWPELLKHDVIISHDWQKWAYALKAEGRLKAPILSVFHAPINTMYQIWPPQFPGLPPIEKACPVCISKDQAAHFEGLFGRPAKVAYNGIDLDFYKPLNVPRSRRFLFLARFSTIKGPDIAIEACRNAGVGLDLVGDTSITNEPEFLAKCVAMCDRGGMPSDPAIWSKWIRMVGPASRSECVWWFSQAHALVHPNQRFREPFGLAPVEAMACGCPVIAWDYGAMRETVKSGVNGLLAWTPEGFLSHLRCGWMGNITPADRAECREWASQFSVENMVNRYHDLCVEAVETGGW